MAQKLSTLANEIWPLLLPRIQKMVADAGAGGGGAAQLVAHDLSGSLHRGTLADSQAPQFLMRNGLRSLAGNLPVDTGVTIDGVDLDVHAANPDAHHARAHVLATAAGLGADHSMSGAAAGQVLRANSATNALWAYLSHNDLTGVTADQHHAKQHDIIDAANHTVAGAAWSVVGATAANTLGLMLARSDATGTPKETLLKSDASGYLSLVRLIASDRLRTSLLDTPAGQHLTVQPAVDLLLDPVSKLVKAQTDVALQASNYASQVTGWRITHNGQADFRYLFVDEMHAKSFIADLEQALAGGQIISKSVALLATAFTAPAANTTVTNGLRVRDLPSAPGMAVFQSGDIVALRAFSRSAGSLSIGYCWGVVTSYTNMGDGTQTWTFSRSAAPNAGAMAAGTVIQPDAIVLDFGTDGNGYYEVNAIDGANAINSPYLQFVRWTGHPATGQAVRTRLGNLRGIFGQDEYGLFAGTGTANTDRYVRISDYAAGNGINNLPFSLRNAGVEVVRLGGWNDVWVGPSSADRRLNWDGATLTVKGAIIIQAGSSGIGSFSDAGVLATVNNLDGVPEGTTYKRTTANEKTGAGRAYGGLGASNELVTKVVPGSNVGTPAGSGLYLGADYLGYYNSAGAVGKKWTVFIDNTGKFGLGGTAGARLGWDGTDLFGTDGTTVQWYARATDGKWYAAAGKLMASAQGISILSETAEPNGGGPTSIAWAKTLPNTNVTGEVYSWDSGSFNELTAVARNIGVTKGVRARIGTAIDYTLSSGMRFSSTYTGGVWTHSYDVYGLGSFWNDVSMYGAFNPAVIWGRGRTGPTTRWNIIPEIDATGVMEVGAYFDFHNSNSDSSDNTLRLDGGMTYSAGLGITNAYGYVAVGPANASYSHFLTNRPAYFFDKPVVIDGTVSTYNQDLELRRNGTNRLIGYSWGTYVTAHLTMEDVFAIVNVQASKPAAPASGVKIYLRDQGGGDGVQLYMQRTNGTETKLS